LTRHPWPGTNTAVLVVVAGEPFVGWSQTQKDWEIDGVPTVNVASE